MHQKVDIGIHVGAVYFERIDVEHLKIHSEVGNIVIKDVNSSQWDADYDKQSAREIKGKAGKNGPQIKVRSSIGSIEVR